MRCRDETFVFVRRQARVYLRSRTDLSARFRLSGEKIPKSEHKIKKTRHFHAFILRENCSVPVRFIFGVWRSHAHREPWEFILQVFMRNTIWPVMLIADSTVHVDTVFERKFIK